MSAGPKADSLIIQIENAVNKNKFYASEKLLFKKNV